MQEGAFRQILSHFLQSAVKALGLLLFANVLGKSKELLYYSYWSRQQTCEETGDLVMLLMLSFHQRLVCLKWDFIPFCIIVLVFKMMVFSFYFEAYK